MLIKFFIAAIAAVLLGELTGCASITTGTNQSVSIKTGAVKDATCSLENNKGTWYINKTPGSVTINRSFNDLSIDCEKKGYKSSHKTVASNTKAMAFGNILFGGIIGAGVDMANGAAYDYPTEIDVPLEKARV